MMHMLGLLIVVFSVSLCDAQCWMEKVKPGARVSQLDYISHDAPWPCSTAVVQPVAMLWCSMGDVVLLGHATERRMGDMKHPNCNSPEALKELKADTDLGCVDKNGVLHKFNTEWRTKDCFRCTCTKENIECCSLVSTPVEYDKVKCKRIFHKNTCKYTVVEKANPSKHCEVRGWVG